MYLSINKKYNVYPCNPQFYFTKVGFKGLNIIQAGFCDRVLSPKIVIQSALPKLNAIAVENNLRN